MVRGGHIRRAFTLIEVLIVVGIIAILAAIAIPNYLEAQIRAKVARTKADLRALATAMESYRVDNGIYPSTFGVLPALSTPVAYISSGNLRDPFGEVLRPDAGWLDLVYSYGNFEEVTFQQRFMFPYVPNPADRRRVVALRWVMMGRGPDGHVEWQDPANNFYSTPATLTSVFQRILDGSVHYDPTNGTVSDGDILYFQPGFLIGRAP